MSPELKHLTPMSEFGNTYSYNASANIESTPVVECLIAYSRGFRIGFNIGFNVREIWECGNVERRLATRGTKQCVMLTVNAIHGYEIEMT